ncbi:hypothetical protein BSK49_19155 [Paenibacillus odorifer]|nr:hypothetical protein BSK49_19155 [Paenibacillus odorifer]
MSPSYKVLESDAEFLTIALKQSQVDIIERRGKLVGCIIIVRVQSRNGVLLVSKLLMLIT